MTGMKQAKLAASGASKKKSRRKSDIKTAKRKIPLFEVRQLLLTVLLT